MAAGNGGQKMSQYSWFTVYASPVWREPPVRTNGATC